MTHRYSLVVSLWIHPGQEAAFEEFERAAARRMARHGGRIDAAVRTFPNGKGDDPEEATAYEIHIVSFPDKAAYDAYANDPETIAARESRAGIISMAMVVPGREAGPYPG
ncbi:MAG TPA: DUF1330 domain-containing protein [Hyphomonadaceae bacterium]|nr:DUF1330 domain-containing protein [Hyphomonadaceae bacterium]